MFVPAKGLDLRSTSRLGRGFKLGLLIAGAGLVCSMCAVLGALAGRHLGVSTYTLSYADFISILLSAISLLMTLLAIFLGVAGVMGWNAISTSIGDRTERFLKEGFAEGEPLHEMLQTQVTNAMYRGVSAVDLEPEGEDDEDTDNQSLGEG